MGKRNGGVLVQRVVEIKARVLPEGTEPSNLVWYSAVCVSVGDVEHGGGKGKDRGTIPRRVEPL